jgi:hypothetical protein
VLIKDDRSSKDLLGIGISTSRICKTRWVSSGRMPLPSAPSTILISRFPILFEENFITTELYKNSPFRVVMDTTRPQLKNVKFNVFMLSTHALSFGGAN